MDFDITTYLRFIKTIKQCGYHFQTFDGFLTNPKERSIILRHDVDLKPQNSLHFAQIQAKNNMKGTFYFRSVGESWNPKIITEIYNLGHEVGYHYESLTTAKGDIDNAIEDFRINLKKLRSLVPVNTICMHGSPLSKYDSKDLWNLFDYRKFDLNGEPYFDLNFNEVLYLTDTGRTWYNRKISVRDHIQTDYKFQFKSTNEIIDAFNRNLLPDQIMFTFHPQRWTDNPISWTKELVVQNLKNQIKKLVVKR